MESADICLAQLLSKCERTKINPKDLDSVKKYMKKNEETKRQLWILLTTVIAFAGFWHYYNKREVLCLLEMPSGLSKTFRSPESCNFCSNVDSIIKTHELSQEEFEHKFAYTGNPVIVVDATKNWTAPKVFDYWYFKNVYQAANKTRKSLSCQFFPYQSGFQNFLEAFNIPSERVNFHPGTDPWYFGWSNCNNEVAEIFRKHYTRPYFLPTTSENNPTDWIFMGGPGLGAHMHVDNVRLPSWQAQLRGSKEWILAPPPECYFECRSFSIIVKEVVLDTNKWYHKTSVLPGGLSITIGAEYD